MKKIWLTLEKTYTEPMSTRALFPGTFDPYTIGHHSLVMRALTFADELIVVVSPNSAKHNLFSASERTEMIANLYANEPKIKVMEFEGLVTDCAKQTGANLIIRGVRSVKDFEYENMLAEVYRHLRGIETALLYTDPQYAFISSSVVREMLKYNQDISGMIPPGMKLPERH